MSIENKKISDEELKNVNGGCGEKVNWLECQGDISRYAAYNIPVGKYSGQVGTKYLFKKRDTQWIFGELVKTYESEFGVLSTRMHDVRVEDGSGLDELGSQIMVSTSGTREVSGDEYQIYAKA